MPREPANKDAIAFVDGQNLYHAARESFGYSVPNYDIVSLAGQICVEQGWSLTQNRFYTGIPDPGDNGKWHGFWIAKTAQMGRQGVHVYTRPLRYRNKTFSLPDGTDHTILVGEEKGVDVRIAIDVIRLAHDQAYDVALVFSQDQDLSEVVDELKKISIEQSRWIKIASAFPVSPTYNNRRGINNTEWIRIDRAVYDAHIDRRNYFRRRR